MIDRLVHQDLVTRTEDQRDRRVRRIGLTRKGADLTGTIINAGAAKQRRMLSRLSAEQLKVVAEATELMLAAAEEVSAEDSAQIEGPGGA
jgi:DNA-binding MarR family transcriptional regulator